MRGKDKRYWVVRNNRLFKLLLKHKSQQEAISFIRSVEKIRIHNWSATKGTR